VAVVGDTVLGLTVDTLTPPIVLVVALAKLKVVSDKDNPVLAEYLVSLKAVVGSFRQFGAEPPLVTVNTHSVL
jgi:hypothetical protein